MPKSNFKGHNCGYHEGTFKLLVDYFSFFLLVIIFGSEQNSQVKFHQVGSTKNNINLIDSVEIHYNVNRECTKCDKIRGQDTKGQEFKSTDQNDTHSIYCVISISTSFLHFQLLDLLPKEDQLHLYKR